MMRVRVASSGWVGGPGLTTFYFTDAVEDNTAAGHCVTRVRSALVEIAKLMPSRITMQVSPDVDVLNPVNGQISATLNGGASVAVLGSAPDNILISPATALVIQFKTDTFLAGRRLAGRIFVSPCAGSVSTDAGIPNPGVPPIAVNVGNILLDTGSTSPLAVVWRRPRKADATRTPPVTAREGTTGRLTSSSMKATFGVLRSRRQ